MASQLGQANSSANISDNQTSLTETTAQSRGSVYEPTAKRVKLESTAPKGESGSENGIGPSTIGESYDEYVSRIEAAVTESLCPGTSTADVDAFVVKVLETEQKAILESKNRKHENSGGYSNNWSCPECKNKDQSKFVEDKKHGDIVCRACGTVFLQHKIHDGEWKRQFEGDVNPSFHGPRPDHRFSSGHNLRTTIAAGFKGMDTNVGGKKTMRELKLAQNYVELNLSNMGSDVRRTREGYKDKMKQEAFRAIEDITASLQLHEQVNHRAEKLFTNYRDMLQQVQKLKLVEAACIIAAFREMISSGGAAEFEKGSFSRAKAEVNQAQLHPFACPFCHTRFNSLKDKRIHKRSCKSNPKNAAQAKNKNKLPKGSSDVVAIATASGLG